MISSPSDTTRWSPIVECAGPLAMCDDPEFHYRFGIDMFVTGVEAVAGRPPRPA
jgi:hypothetical protein